MEPSGSLATGQADHTATLLGDGTVAGGVTTGSIPLASAEIYNPEKG